MHQSQLFIGDFDSQVLGLGHYDTLGYGVAPQILESKSLRELKLEHCTHDTIVSVATASLSPATNFNYIMVNNLNIQVVSRSEYFLIIIERTITPYVDKDIDKVLNYFVIQDKNILQQSYSSFKF